jgi:Ca-activated chloride channel family protein
MRWRWLRLALPLTVAFASTVNAGADYTISDNVDLVLLDVSVKHPDGAFVSGLGKNNFRVYEDGRACEITHFESVDTPVSIGLVLDNSGSMRPKRPEIITAGLAFAKSSNPRDQFFVINFNNQIYYGLPRPLNFTDNMQLLHNALFYGLPQGQTALYDAIASALHHLELSGRTLRTLIVVSDGGDNVSLIRFNELMKLIESSRATVYTIGLWDPDDHDLNPRVLRKLAAVSGGEYFQPDKLNEVLPIFEKISKDIRHRYTIGFVPDERNDTNTLRTVKVSAQADGRRLNVRTRASFSLTPMGETGK